MIKKLLFIVLFFAISFFSFGQTATFSSSGTFTIPAGVTSLTVQAWGGGGCSGNNTDGRGRGGGGGGAYTGGTIAVTPGAVLNITVGAGGIYNNGNTVLDDGFASSVGVIVANGGKRGLIANNTVTNNGGNGGLASVNPGGVASFLSFNGGNGGSGYVGADNGGGGGGGESASFLGNGNSGGNGTSGGTGGTGGTGNVSGGDGGKGSNNGTSNSSNGFSPGGGGGGRGDDSGNDTNGGAGQVILTWTCPVFAATLFGTTQSICYNREISGTNIGGVSFSNVPVERYVAINVISGVQYRIATTATDKGFIKRLTLFNGSNTTTALTTTNASLATTAATIDWTATFTGVLYVVFNTANCQSNVAQDDITVSYIGGNNTADNQTAYGTDSWIGHVYNFSDSAGVSPLSDTDAFASYLGYFTQANTVSGTTISFNNDYNTSTSTTTCFPFVAGSTPQSFYTETFAVKYRMRSSLTGCYLVNVDGDDGVRLTVDGVKILDAWVQQGITPYTNVLIYLDATKNGGTGSELLFEYYEKNGNNVSNFRMVPFDSTTNTIVAPTPANVCSGSAPGLINGSAYAYNGSTVNPSIKFQWETATSATGPWTNATGGTGATSEDYTPGLTTTTGVVTNYYRRVVSAVASNATACTWTSNTIVITTSASGIPAAPNSTAATNVSCSSFTANWNTVPTATSYLLDVSTVNTFATFVTGYNALNVGFVTSYNVTGLSAGNYFYRLRANNGCGNTTSAGYSGVITVSVANSTATISGGTTVCQNANTPNITFTNPRSNAITVTYNINGGTSATINVGANATASVAASTSASGSFVYNLVSVVYQSAPTCSTTLSGSATITVTPTVGAPTTPAGGTATICQGSAATSYTTSATDATTYNWTVSGTGNTISGTGTTGTVTWASGFSGNATISVTANGCNGPSVAATRNITVAALPTTPAATVTIQPTCSVNTGTIVVTSPTGAGITYSIDGTNYYTSGTFNNVAIGSHTVSVKNSSNCVATMASPLSVSPPATKMWQGGQGTGAQLTDWSYGPNWNPAGIPTSADCVVIPTTPNNPIISGTNLEFYANTFAVTGTGSLIVQKGNTLKVENAVIVAATGTLTFEDSSSLLQTTTRDDLNTGNINYMRSTPAPGIRQADYVYWSTPVKNQTLSGVSQDLTLSDKYYMYGGTGVSWIGVPKTTVMEIGKGYIIRGPQNWSNTSRNVYTATFKGTPNNGSFTTHENFKAGKNYLIGNPYPSALYADKLITDNPVLEGTLYFWTHNTPVVLVGAYKYEADDYATYNLTGGTIVTKEAAKTGDDDTSYNDDPPSGYIAAGQSFMAAFKAAGEITFTNSMRYGGSHNSQFFKPGKTSKTTGLEKNRVWLNLTNEEGLFKQMLVGYIEGATNNYEGWYDGLSVNGNKYADFYSISSTDKFTIQGRALPFTAADTVPLGYVSSIVGDFTISVDHADGLFDNQPIYLEDKATGKIHDLRTANYTFATEKGTFNDRFVLRYTNKTLGTGDFENVENGLLVAVKDKTIKVTSAKEAIKEVTIFDINGKLLYNKKKVGATELQISNLQAANQVLLVKVTLENDFTTTKKIIFQ